MEAGASPAYTCTPALFAPVVLKVMVSVPSSLSVAAMSLISSPVTALLDFPAMTAEYTVSPSVAAMSCPVRSPKPQSCSVPSKCVV